MLALPPEAPAPEVEAPSDPAIQKPPRWFERIFTRRRLVLSACIIGALILLVVGTFTVSYWKYSRLIDARLRDGPFRDSVNIYAAPLVLSVGDQVTPADLVAELRTAGYDRKPGANAPSYSVSPGAVKILPAGSAGPSTVVSIANNQISRLVTNGKDVKENTLGSPLITTLSSANSKEAGNAPKHEEGLLVTFSVIPPVLVHAIVSAEDKRFFKHRGLDLRRVLKAAYV